MTLAKTPPPPHDHPVALLDGRMKRSNQLAECRRCRFVQARALIAGSTVYYCQRLGIHTEGPLFSCVAWEPKA